MSEDQSDNELEKLTFLTSPIKWRPPINRADSDDNGNHQEDQLESLLNLPCGNAATARSTSNDSCDIEFDLIVNPFMARALDVLKFHVLFDLETSEMEDIIKPFGPLMAHQIFGNDEVIIGYRNLRINISLLPNSFHAKLDYSYSSISNNPLRGEIADNITEKFQDWFPHLVDVGEFTQLRETENLMKVHGENLLKFKIYDSNNISSKIYINKCDPNNAEFLAFHKRFQALIVFFIDAASVIDFTDPNWTYYYVYKDIVKNGQVIAKLPIGFCTVYKYFVSKRARISQFFILPNFQQRGLGSRLLGVIYKEFRKEDDFKFITVECPCQEFSMLRDKLDLRLVIKWGEFSRENVIDGYTPAMGVTAQKRWKLCPEQAKHLANVLRCYYTKTDTQQQTRFIRDMKKGFYNNYKKKLMRITCKAAKEERIARLKRIVDDDYLLNRTVHRDVMGYMRKMQPHMKYIENLLLKA